MIHIHTPCLFALCGPTGSGKSTLARQLSQAGWFAPSAIISSDHTRLAIADDEGARDCNTEAFALVHQIARIRLRNNRIAVLDSTSLRPHERTAIAELARECGVTPYLIFVDPPAEELSAHRQQHPKNFPAEAYRRMDRLAAETRRAIKRGYEEDNFQHVFHIQNSTDLATMLAETTFSPSIPRLLHPEWIVIGDVHSCADELVELVSLGKAQYPNAKFALVGDIINRGNKPVETVRFVLQMLQEGHIWVPGNHDTRAKRIRRENTEPRKKDCEILQQVYQMTRETLTILDAAGLTEDFLNQMPDHPHVIVGDADHPLAITHAALSPHMAGKCNRRIRRECLYGILGEEQPNSLPARQDWQGIYIKAGAKIAVAAGHTPVTTTAWREHTINLDTGCAFGGRLSATHWPSREILSVKAKQVYATGHAEIAQAQELNQNEKVFLLPNPERPLTLELTHHEPITIRPDKLQAALGKIGDVSPWHLWWLAPTISPAPQLVNDTQRLLEHPAQAVEFYRNHGIRHIIAQTKHMGSRATALICRNPDIAQSNFGDVTTFVCYSRNLWPFFKSTDPRQAEMETTTAAALTSIWPDWEWALLDMEILPWSLKGTGLITEYFLPTGLGKLAYRQKLASYPNLPQWEPLTQEAQRLPAAEAYVNELKLYGQPDNKKQWQAGIFNLLACQHGGKRINGWAWSGEETEQFVAAFHQHDPAHFLPLNTSFHDLESPQSIAALDQRWRQNWGAGEGVVIKPNFQNCSPSAHPAIKVRNPDYLRLIYGVDYLDQLEEHRKRSLKRKLDISQKEYAITTELLANLVRSSSWQDCHHYALGFVALDQEPLDPRL